MKSQLEPDGTKVETTTLAGLSASLDTKGFAIVHRLFDEQIVAELKQSLTQAKDSRLEREGEIYGARNLFVLPTVREAARFIQDRLSPVLEDTTHAVRAIFFDKTARANWLVPWHQDLSVALKHRLECPGWTNWSIKAGVLHAQPPGAFLDRMVTARIHLDDCSEDNGALRVIPGSHRAGRLSREAICAAVASVPERLLTARSGDIVLMKPLLLHASSRASNPAHRRVLQIEFAPAVQLPSQLEWAEAV
ncbi:MAG TPA: phytanoyl-CoA dioxygenase family protein [Rhizomicrobium sp.]